jgi:hypothetical protein
MRHVWTTRFVLVTAALLVAAAAGFALVKTRAPAPPCVEDQSSKQ